MSVGDYSETQSSSFWHVYPALSSGHPQTFAKSDIVRLLCQVMLPTATGSQPPLTVTIVSRHQSQATLSRLANPRAANPRSKSAMVAGSGKRGTS